jgi:hypothetical protein
VSNTGAHKWLESHLRGGALRSGKSNTNRNASSNRDTDCHARSYADTIRVSWRLYTIANADSNRKTYADSAASAYPTTAAIASSIRRNALLNSAKLSRQL